MDKCFLEELADSIEIDLTFNPFHSPSHVSLRDRFSSRLNASYSDIRRFYLSITEYATGGAVQEKHLRKL